MSNFLHCEEVDLCRPFAIPVVPSSLLPEAVITHLGGQSVSRFPTRFEIEKHRSRYRYFTNISVPGRRDASAVYLSLGFVCASLLMAFSTCSSPRKLFRAGWKCTVKFSDGTRLSIPWTSSNVGEEPRLEHASVPQIRSSFRLPISGKIQAQQRKDSGKDAYIIGYRRRRLYRIACLLTNFSVGPQDCRS